MKKKTNVKTMIRQIVREEVAMAIQEVISELKQPTVVETKQVKKPKSKKIVSEQKQYSNNSILNEVLNETDPFESQDYALMGDKVFDSNSVEEIANRNNISDSIVSPSAPEEIKNIFDKDFSKILKQSYKKRG